MGTSWLESWVLEPSGLSSLTATSQLSGSGSALFPVKFGKPCETVVVEGLGTEGSEPRAVCRSC